MSEKKQCAETLPARCGILSAMKDCGTPAKYYEVGRFGGEPAWWCHHHAPSKIKAKEEKWVAEFDAKQAAKRAAKDKVKATREALFEALDYCDEDNVNRSDGFVRGLADALHVACRELEALRDACREAGL